MISKNRFRKKIIALFSVLDHSSSNSLYKFKTVVTGTYSGKLQLSIETLMNEIWLHYMVEFEFESRFEPESETFLGDIELNRCLM